MFLQSEEYNLTRYVDKITQSPCGGGGYSDIFKGELCERLKSSWWNNFMNLNTPCRPKIVAIKFLRNTHHLALQDRDRIKRSLNNEAEIWHNLDHFNVLPLLGYMYMGDSHPASIPSLVSPWCDGGTIAEYIQDKRPRVADRISLMLQVISAVGYLHSSRPPIVHGDLKPDNFFLQSNYQVRLSDFGLAKIPSEGTGTRFSNTGDGTVRFMSPEFFTAGNNAPMRSLASDIWALGWTFYLILTGSYPYPDEHSWGIPERVRNGDLPELPNSASAGELKQLQITIWPIMIECWQSNPNSRPGVEKVTQNLREAILLNESHHFGGPMFTFMAPGQPRPSIIGDEDASILEFEGYKEHNEDRARGALVASALEYLCQWDMDCARSVQIDLGWKLLEHKRYSIAQAHLSAAQASLHVTHPSIVRCKRGLAHAAQYGSGNFTEAIEHYRAALAICRAQDLGYAEQEYMLVRELVQAIFDDPRNQGPAKEPNAQQEAREHLIESLSFFSAQENLQYQAQVRCDLAQLEQDAGNRDTAQAYAVSAFQCALETGLRNLAESVYSYLVDANILPEARRNGLYIELQAMPVISESQSLASSWAGSIASFS